MSYIGNSPTRGQWRKLTDISGSFNGVTTTFTTSVPPGNAADYVTAPSANQLLISLGGVIQEPNVDYTVNTNTVTFTTAPAAGLSFFGVLCGDALDGFTPADGSVTTSKLANGLSINLASSTPANASATGTAGQISWDADYIYVCTATNTWKRVAIATWP